MRRLAWLAPVAALAVCALLAWFGVADILDRRRTGADAVDRATADAAHAAEQPVAEARRAADTVYVRDTVTLTAVETRFRRLRDTLRLSDTVQVFRAFALADTVVRACRGALATAERRLSLCDSTARLLTVQRDAWRRIATRPGPRVETSVAALYDWTAGAPVAEAGVRLRLAGRLAAVGAVRQALAPREGPHVQAGVKWTF